MKSILSIIIIFLAHTFQMLHAKIPTLSEKAQISVLTCSSGDELFSSFGHTAFRVQDPVLGIDIVYNYGTFDFNKPNFYLNFAKGKLIYSLSRKSFEAFLYDYQLEKRWIKEQLLDLNQEQTNQLLKFFEENYKPENRDYPYDPLFNNCSTITGDILEQQLGKSIKFNGSHLKELLTFRQLVHQHIKTNKWGTFGIDLAFGGITDREATVRQHMFLPYYAMHQLNNTTYNGKPILSRERTISNYPEKSDQSTFMLSPLFWFSLLLAFVIAITYLDKKHHGRSRFLDFVLFFISGLAGLFILLLWLATNHVVTQLNFNFLWLLPFNLIVSFYLLSKKKLPNWLSKYLWVALGLIIIMLVIWIFRIQVLSWLNLILMLVLTIRYLFLLKKI
ncbi:DUF4105 domain-containing protein [Croceitalea rosinachiae]|uniref:DUF4105 domain-containing protein n=1 Tax=Croceitalea rosinachiae TaxID=3075596 RepID=A0ABU3A9U4_9FLAO|nr:DUF4105 domain-containing protein [Croceitalea sp. F388]MDT0606951.1 DUF4105 domain-containing protein [Croceitalea sp. F388]